MIVFEREQEGEGHQSGEVGNKYAQKPIGSREQCAQKPIKSLSGPAPWAVLFFFPEKVTG